VVFINNSILARLLHLNIIVNVEVVVSKGKIETPIGLDTHQDDEAKYKDSEVKYRDRDVKYRDKNQVH